MSVDDKIKEVEKRTTEINYKKGYIDAIKKYRSVKNDIDNIIKELDDIIDKFKKGEDDTDSENSICDDNLEEHMDDINKLYEKIKTCNDINKQIMYFNRMKKNIGKCKEHLNNNKIENIKV